MPGPIAQHFSELAESLGALKGRLREAARIEVARTIGEALREAAHALIIGPARRQHQPRSSSVDWDDRWHDPSIDPWDDVPEELLQLPPKKTAQSHSSRVPLALSAGFGAARLCFTRSGQIFPAIAIGVTIAGVAYAGGPFVDSLLDVLCQSHDLLTFPAKNDLR